MSLTIIGDEVQPLVRIKSTPYDQTSIPSPCANHCTCASTQLLISIERKKERKRRGDKPETLHAIVLMKMHRRRRFNSSHGMEDGKGAAMAEAEAAAQIAAGGSSVDDSAGSDV